VRIDVAKQRRKVARARAHLASAKIRRRASDVPVELAFQSGGGLAHVARKAACVLADDGFYCFSNDGAWGARVHLFREIETALDSGTADRQAGQALSTAAASALTSATTLGLAPRRWSAVASEPSSLRASAGLPAETCSSTRCSTSDR